MHCHVRRPLLTAVAFAALIALAGAVNAARDLGITDPGRWYNSGPLTLAALRGERGEGVEDRLPRRG